MSEKTVTITLPEPIYERLQEIADTSQWTMEDVLRRCIKSGMPPLLDKVPEVFHDELLALNELDDQELWRIVMGEVPIARPLDTQHKRADFPALRRSYAFALLKWRGHPVPLPYEFFME